MCGISGLMNFSKNAVNNVNMGAFMQMIHAGALRGMHGTGAFAIADDGSSYRVRVGGPPHELINSSEFDKFEKFVTKKYVRAVVGHNRYATKGGISTETSHPFRDGEIILVHNGTLDSFGHLPDADKYVVDSEAICHSIAVDGVEKTVKSLRGAWTLVWYDGNNKTMNFLRNSKRPLFMARHENEPFIAFASEPEMLKWLLNRNGMYLFDVKELPENQMYSYALDSIKPHVKELKGASDSFYDEKYWTAWGERMKEESAGTGKSHVQADSKIIPFQPLNSSKKNSVNEHNTHSGSSTNLTNNRGSLSLPIKVGSTSSHIGKGHWAAAQAIHDLSVGQVLRIWPMDSHSVGKAASDKEEMFEVKGLIDSYPDIEFICYIRGGKLVDAVMEAPNGMRAQIKSILRSMNAVAKFPHQIYLENPEPLYVEEPAVIPAHAEVKH
jgi:hypothetical protein